MAEIKLAVGNNKISQIQTTPAAELLSVEQVIDSWNNALLFVTNNVVATKIF